MLANGKTSSIVSQQASDINVSLVQSKPRLCFLLKKKKPIYIDTRNKIFFDQKDSFLSITRTCWNTRLLSFSFLKFVGDTLPVSSLLFMLNQPELLKIRIIYKEKFCIARCGGFLEMAGWGLRKKLSYQEVKHTACPPKIWPESIIAFISSSQEAHKTRLSLQRGSGEKFSHLPNPDRGGSVNFSLLGSSLILLSLCPRSLSSPVPQGTRNNHIMLNTGQLIEPQKDLLFSCEIIFFQLGVKFT